MDPKPGARLKEFREAELGPAGKKLSMAQLGARVRPKASASTINKLEKAQTELTMEWARRLGDALGRHQLDFFDAEPKLPPRRRALVNLMDGLSEADEDAIFRIADAMAEQRKLKGLSSEVGLSTQVRDRGRAAPRATTEDPIKRR